MVSEMFKIPLEDNIEILSNEDYENIVWEELSGNKTTIWMIQHNKSKTDDCDSKQSVSAYDSIKDMRANCTRIPVCLFATSVKVSPMVRSRVLKYFADVLNYQSASQLTNAIGLPNDGREVMVPPIDKLDVKAQRWDEYRRRQIALMIIICFDLCQSLRTADDAIESTAHYLGQEGKIILKHAVEVLARIEFDKTHKILRKYPKPQGFFI